MTTKPSRINLFQVRSFADLRLWWNRVVDIKVKVIVLTFFAAAFTSMGMQYQLNTLTNERIDSICQERKSVRDDIRLVLHEIVDLSDVFPDVPEAEAYTANRKDFIDEHYEVLSSQDSGCATNQ